MCLSVLGALPVMANDLSQEDLSRPKTSSNVSIIGRNIFGLAYDYQGTPIHIDSEPLILRDPVDIDIDHQGKRFQFSIFPGQIGSVYVTHFNKKRSRAVDTFPINLEEVSGLTNPIGAVRSEWGSVLLSENQLVDPYNSSRFSESFKPFFKEKQDLVNPYHYGWLTEAVILNDQGESKLIKHYAVGRLASDKVVVLPNRKGLLLLDRTYSGNLYYFESQQPEIFSRGTLYHVGLLNDELKLTLLGESSSLKIKFRLKKLRPEDVLTLAQPNNSTTQGDACAAGFRYINTMFGSECIKPKSKAKRYAGLLSPVRMSAYHQVPSFKRRISDIQLTENAQAVTLSFGSNTERFSLDAVNAPMKSDQ